MIERTEYLTLLKNFKDKDLIKIITGIRRSGKLCLLREFRSFTVAYFSNVILTLMRKGFIISSFYITGKVKCPSKDI